MKGPEGLEFENYQELLIISLDPLLCRELH
jgi:hypothetical protein